MQLRHLTYFLATAEAGSVSAAANLVHVSQPSISRQLRQLEADLGVDLFERAPGKLTISRTGLALLPAVHRLLASAEELQSAARFHALGHVERITIAAPTVTLTDVVSPFVATMSPEEPVVDVRQADGLSSTEVLEGGADLVIGTHRPPRPYAYRKLADLSVFAYVRDDDPWSGHEQVTLSELCDRTLIGLPATFTAREALDRAIEGAGLDYAEIIEAANGTIAQAMAAAGRGVAVVTDDPRYDLVPIRVLAGRSPLRIRLVAAWDPRGVASSTMSALAARLQAWILEQYGEPREG